MRRFVSWLFNYEARLPFLTGQILLRFQKFKGDPSSISHNQARGQVDAGTASSPPFVPADLLKPVLEPGPSSRYGHSSASRDDPSKERTLELVHRRLAARESLLPSSLDTYIRNGPTALGFECGRFRAHERTALRSLRSMSLLVLARAHGKIRDRRFRSGSLRLLACWARRLDCRNCLLDVVCCPGRNVLARALLEEVTACLPNFSVLEFRALGESAAGAEDDRLATGPNRFRHDTLHSAGACFLRAV